MKLLTRTNRYYIFFSIITYFIVAGSFYLVVEYLIYKEVDERLVVESKDFEHFITVNGYWEVSCYFVEDKINVTPYTEKERFVPFFKDTVLLNRYSHIPVPFREYNFIFQIAEDDFHVSIRKSLIESRQLLKVITVIMLVFLSVGLSLLFLFQRRISKHLWRPFFDTLSKAKSFDINEGVGLKLTPDQIYEFNELNMSLMKMTGKIASDYKSLKEFTENASHEIQTPLSLINSRIEGLIQDKSISGQHMAWLQDIHESTLRLSKLNQTLLLLSKIENGQFYETMDVNFGKMIEEKIIEQEELFGLKGIKLTLNLPGTFTTPIHPVLADVLLTNLLNNAIKHNLNSNGTIDITVTDHALIFSNTGHKLTLSADELFGRFRKDSKSSSSIGLGLAIAKKICEINHLHIQYESENEQHTIRISKTI